MKNFGHYNIRKNSITAMILALLTRFDAASFHHRILAFLGCFEQVLQFLDSCHTSL